MSNIFNHLSFVQKNLNAPKDRKNTFGNYNYRNCEDILEAVKKIMPDRCYITLKDEMVLIGERYYVKAEAIFSFEGEHISRTAYAREPNEKKGYDVAQITGATSSYARKYALNGLFAIDDSKDQDSMDNREEPRKQQATQTKKSEEKPKPTVTDDHRKAANALGELLLMDDKLAAYEFLIAIKEEDKQPISSCWSKEQKEQIKLIMGKPPKAFDANNIPGAKYAAV